jgi:hypothetical protein
MNQIRAKTNHFLSMNYPDQSGFSVRNLWNMKRFYVTYQQYERLQALPAEYFSLDRGVASLVNSEESYLQIINESNTLKIS